MTEQNVKEGMISVKGGNIWYRVVVENGGIPILFCMAGQVEHPLTWNRCWLWGTSARRFTHWHEV